MATGEITPKVSPRIRKGSAGQIVSYIKNGTIVGPFTGGTPGYVPTWQSNGTVAWAAQSAGSGTVNLGVAGELAYYATSASAVSTATYASISSGALTLGANTSTVGTVTMYGGTSGSCIVKTAAIAGSST